MLFQFLEERISEVTKLPVDLSRSPQASEMVLLPLLSMTTPRPFLDELCMVLLKHIQPWETGRSWNVNTHFMMSLHKWVKGHHSPCSRCFSSTSQYRNNYTDRWQWRTRRRLSTEVAIFSHIEAKGLQTPAFESKVFQGCRTFLGGRKQTQVKTWVLFFWVNAPYHPISFSADYEDLALHPCYDRSESIKCKSSEVYAMLWHSGWDLCYCEVCCLIYSTFV